MTTISESAIQRITTSGESLGLSQTQINDAIQRAAEEINEGRLEEHAVRSAYFDLVAPVVSELPGSLKDKIVEVLKTHNYMSFEGPLLDATCSVLADKILVLIK